MTLEDGIKNLGRPFEIPDCSRNDLPEFFVRQGFKRGVEIGVYKGDYSQHFAIAGLEHYAIDPWQIYSDYKNIRGQKRLDFQFGHTHRLLDKYPNCTIIRKTSIEALEDFEDDSLDYVYIDGNHHLRYVVEDIVEWSKKVRPGGVVSGHDWIWTPFTATLNVCHVVYAIKAYINAYNIEHFWVLGRKEYVKGEVRDRWRSWMWFNNSGPACPDVM